VLAEIHQFLLKTLLLHPCPLLFLHVLRNHTLGHIKIPYKPTILQQNLIKKPKSLPLCSPCNPTKGRSWFGLWVRRCSWPSQPPSSQTDWTQSPPDFAVFFEASAAKIEPSLHSCCSSRGWTSRWPACLRTTTASAGTRPRRLKKNGLGETSSAVYSC
jgi:hypothetical protein